MSKLTDIGVATSSAVVPGMDAVTDRGCLASHNQVATPTTWSASMAGLAVPPLPEVPGLPRRVSCTSGGVVPDSPLSPRWVGLVIAASGRGSRLSRGGHARDAEHHRYSRAHPATPSQVLSLSKVATFQVPDSRSSMAMYNLVLTASSMT